MRARSAADGQNMISAKGINFGRIRAVHSDYARLDVDGQNQRTQREAEIAQPSSILLLLLVSQQLTGALGCCCTAVHIF
jgi:hypothetical protein